MKIILATLGTAIFLLVNAPPAALAFQAHPKPHKVTKHRPKGAKRRHFFKKKHKAVTAVPRFFA